MKKILTTIAIATLACTTVQAQGWLETYNFFDVEDEHSTPRTPITLSGGGAVTTLGNSATSGYVAAYWWSSDGVNYSAIGIGGFTDYELGFPSGLDGTFYFMSEQIMPTPGTGFLGLTVFRHDIGDGTWDAFFADLMVSSLTSDPNSAKIEALWDAAQSSTYGEIGDWWGAELVFDADGGFTPFDVFGTSKELGGFGWDGAQALRAIPEPSTWLLLGAGAAFVVLLRRRRK